MLNTPFSPRRAHISGVYGTFSGSVDSFIGCGGKLAKNGNTSNIPAPLTVAAILDR